MPTKEYIREQMLCDYRWLARGILAIYSQQTATEQERQRTHKLNGVGFNGTDAFILSSFAKQLQEGRTLSQKQQEIARKKMPKYAGQLAKLAQAKEA